MQWRTAVRTRWALLTWALVMAAACSPSSADRAGPAATVPQEAPTSTLPADPYAVPPVIDEAYVNRVLAGLDAALGDVTRLVIQTRTFPREAFYRLKAIYENGEFLQLTIDGYQRDLRQGLDGYRDGPGNQVSKVDEIISRRNGCIFASVRRDYSAVGKNGVTNDPQWIAMKRVSVEEPSRAFNPTGWAYIYDGFPPTRTRPQDPCDA